MAGQEYFGIRLDTDKLEQDAAKAKKAFDEIGKKAQETGKKIDNSISGESLASRLKKSMSEINNLTAHAFDGVSTNAQKMIKDIQESTLQLRNVERLMSELNLAYEKGAVSQNDYINAAARLTVVHDNIAKSIRDTEAALKAQNVVVEQLADDSMTALQTKVTLLTTEYMKLSKAQRESAQGESLLKNISEVNAELQKAQVAMGKYGTTAASQFNALGFSIQQIARELPSLTLSPQMFFLAISNNLPMFTDALANARKEFEALKAAGQKATPVWKQVAKSLFSWQTAISLLPTLLLLYGEDIIKFFSDIFEGSKKIDYASERIKALREVISEGDVSAQKDITQLNLLYNATQDVTRSMEERVAAVNELQQQYPSFFENMSQEEILTGKAAGAYQRLATSIIASARARAAQDKMVENAKIILENEQKITDAYAERDKAQQRLVQAQKSYNENWKGVNAEAQRFLAETVASRQRDVDAIDEQISGYRRVIYETNKLQRDLSDSINIQDLIFDPSKGKESNNRQKQSIDNLKQYLNELLGLQEDNEERQIELTKSGTEKQIALIELRYSRQIEAVKKLQEEITKAQGGKLTADQKGIFGTAITGLQGMKTSEITEVQSKQLNSEKKAMNEYLAEYGNYMQKRLAITEKYQDEIAKSATKGQKLTLKEEMTEVLAALDDEAQKKTSIITKLFGDMSKKSVSEMRKIADEAEQLLAFIEGGEYQKDNAFGITEEQFKVLSESPEKLESIKNEIQNVRNEADAAEPTFERIKDLLQKIFNVGDSGENLEKWLSELNSEVNKVMQSVGFLSNAFTSLGDAFGNETMTGIGEGLNMAMDAVNTAMQGAQAGSLFGPIGAAAGAAIGVVTSLATSIAQVHDKRNEKNIERLQDQIDVLTNSYDDLGKAVEEAYSKDAYNLIEQQNELLEQQKILIQNQIKEEEKKKKTDDERIKEWKEQLEQIDEQLGENKEKAIDAIFGEDVQSAIDNFATSLTDAWAQGTDASTSARESVRRIMQQMVSESIKAAIQTSGKMEEIRKKLQEFYADNVLEGWEQDYIYNMADKLQQELDRQFGWSEGLFADKTTSAQTATSGGFETMSQDTANELNGRFTALYESSLRIETQISIGNVNLEAAKDAALQMRDLTQNCYLELVEIRENTGAVVKPIQQMQKDITEMKNTIKERL